jgi:hypothetical protein
MWKESSANHSAGRAKFNATLIFASAGSGQASAFRQLCAETYSLRGMSSDTNCRPSMPTTSIGTATCRPAKRVVAPRDAGYVDLNALPPPANQEVAIADAEGDKEDQQEGMEAVQICLEGIVPTEKALTAR